MPAINKEKLIIMPINKFTWLSKSAIDIMKISKLIAPATFLSIGLSLGNVVIAGQKQKLPFIGTRYFNFMGGTGTNQAITIDKNGKTTISKNFHGTFHGTVSTGVVYQGKFSNPITINDRGIIIYKYLFKENKIYILDKDGKIEKDCRREGEICEAGLSKDD